MRRELFTSVNTKAERIFDIQSTYTISQCFLFKPNLGAGMRSQTGRRKQGDEQTTTIQTVLNVLLDWNTVHKLCSVFCRDLQSGRVNAVVAESQTLRANL